MKKLNRVILSASLCLINVNSVGQDFQTEPEPKVELTTSSGGNISLEDPKSRTYKFSFGEVPIGGQGQKVDFTLKNTGDGDLFVKTENFAMTGVNFTKNEADCVSKSPLKANSSCLISITFTPANTGKAEEELKIQEKVTDLFGESTIFRATLKLEGTGKGQIPVTLPLAVTKSGTGQGTITSTPVGISCGPTCNFNFEANQSVTLTATPGTDSDFAGWSPADKCPLSTSPTCTLTLTANATVTATFNLKATPKVTLTVTKAGTGTGQVKSDPPGIDCGTTCQQPFETTANTTVTLTATPDTNSTFTGWTGDCSGKSCQVTMNATKNVTATFTSTPPPTSTTPTSFSLNIDKGNGEVKCNQVNCESTYPPDKTIALTAIPPTGFQFDGWSGDCTGNGDCNLLMDKNKTVKAMFIPQTPVVSEVTKFPLTITPTPTTGEVKCHNVSCDPQYPQGTAVTLTATPKPGYEFINWEGCTPNATDPKICTVTMDSAKTVTANFKLSNVLVTPVTPATTFPLTVNPTTGEVKCNNMTCDTQYPQGIAVTLTATPKPDHEFARWEGCTATPTDSKVCVVTMDSPKTVTATFNPVSPPPVQSFPLQVYLTGPGKVLCNNVECLPTQTYTANTPVTLTVVPSPGNTFTGWTGACTGNIVPCQLTISEAKTVSATFELPPPPPPSQPVMMIPVVPTCATDSTSISDTCKGQGKSLACNVTIERSANLSNVRFACDATNRGWIANSTIQTGITVTGGVFTGYITNQGTLADFEFLGASIIGGTLAGHIVNDSKVGGYFKDVHLAAQTYITGGTLAGTLTGDCQAPATLENVKVKAGSHLSCVELGKKVKLEKNVTVEKPK